MTGDCCVVKFLRPSVDGKYLMRLQSETSVFRFFRGSVEGPKGANLHTRCRIIHGDMLRHIAHVANNKIACCSHEFSGAIATTPPLVY